ncbi:MAG: alpha-glucosidase C-terminal domain-containing protein, partial [Chloroflexia bacterium]
MGDNIYLNDRDGVRTPMQWAGDRNGGFSQAGSDQLYNQVIADSVYGYQAVNVEAQQSTQTSLLNWMKRIIRVRKQYPTFGRGDITFLNPANQQVLAYIRSHEGTNILCVNNLSRSAQPCELDLSAFNGAVPMELLDSTPFPSIGELPYFLTLGPYGFYWFKLERDA